MFMATPDPRHLPVGASIERAEGSGTLERGLVHSPRAGDDVVVAVVAGLVRADHLVAREIDAVASAATLEHEGRSGGGVRRLDELREEREPSGLEEVESSERPGDARVRVGDDGDGELAGEAFALVGDVLGVRSSEKRDEEEASASGAAARRSPW